MKRGYLAVAAGLIAVAVLAVVVARSTDPDQIGGGQSIESVRDLPVLDKGPQPSLDLGNGFVNGEPQIKGKVVLYDFWTYSCINCVRTLPYLRAWHERYAKDGLVIVGVHSPEFDFEKIHRNVTAAMKKLKVTYPVVFDDDMKIWGEFHNQYWPAKYIADKQGRLRYVHFGEGDYDDTETVIRLLLGTAKDAPRAADPKQPQSTLTMAITRETYLGSERGGTDAVKLEGRWKTEPQYVESTDAHETLKLTYVAGEVNLVIDRTRKNPTYAVVELDGKPVPESARGADLVVRDGQTMVDIDDADLYRLVAGGPSGEHVLSVHPGGSGVQLFAFTFGS